MPRPPRSPRRISSLLALVALVALGLASWVEFRSPGRAWLRAIHDPDPATRVAAWSRVQAGPIEGVSSDETAAEIAAALGDPDPTIRVAGLQAIGHLPALLNDPAATLPRVTPLLGDPHPRVRGNALGLARSMVAGSGSGRDALEPRVRALATDPDPFVRAQALEAARELIRVGNRPGDPLLDLEVAMLADAEPDVRYRAANNLERTERAAALIPFWEREMLEARSRPFSRRQADLAGAGRNLGRVAVHLRSEPALAFLLAGAYLPQAGVDRPSGPIANPFLASLLEAVAADPGIAVLAVSLATRSLGASESDARLGAAIFLESIGQVAPARAVWLETLRHPDPALRRLAIEALATQGPGQADALPPLRALAGADADPAVRRDAAEALAIVGLPGPAG